MLNCAVRSRRCRGNYPDTRDRGLDQDRAAVHAGHHHLCVQGEQDHQGSGRILTSGTQPLRRKEAVETCAKIDKEDVDCLLKKKRVVGLTCAQHCTGQLNLESAIHRQTTVIAVEHRFHHKLILSSNLCKRAAACGARDDQRLRDRRRITRVLVCALLVVRWVAKRCGAVVGHRLHPKGGNA